jgi:hypothetical protein
MFEHNKTSSTRLLRGSFCCRRAGEAVGSQEEDFSISEGFFLSVAIHSLSRMGRLETMSQRV